MDEPILLTASEIDEQIEELLIRRREFVRKIWNIESDIISLKEEKLKRFPKRYDDVEK